MDAENCRENIMKIHFGLDVTFHENKRSF